MENYTKGKNIEEPLEREKIPIVELPSNFLWMQVRGGSKIRNLLSHALNEFPQINSVVWTGFGSSTGKAVTCAEIMKKEYSDNLYQITKICYRKVEEFWDPKIPELEQIVVTRKLPMVHILLSSTPLDTKQLGYQVSTSLRPMESFDQKTNEPTDSNKTNGRSNKSRRKNYKKFENQK